MNQMNVMDPREQRPQQETICSKLNRIADGTEKQTYLLGEIIKLLNPNAEIQDLQKPDRGGMFGMLDMLEEASRREFDMIDAIAGMLGAGGPIE